MSYLRRKEKKVLPLSLMPVGRCASFDTPRKVRSSKYFLHTSSFWGLSYSTGRSGNCLIPLYGIQFLIGTAFNPEGYQYLLAKARQQHSLGFKNTVVFARLYDWRDQVYFSPTFFCDQWK